MASDLDCKFVLQLNSSTERCDFVVNNTDCQEASGYFNYVELLYCDFSGNAIFLDDFGGSFQSFLLIFLADRQLSGLALFGSWMAFLFVGLAVSADDFFCPNLDTMSKKLR